MKKLFVEYQYADGEKRRALYYGRELKDGPKAVLEELRKGTARWIPARNEIVTEAVVVLRAVVQDWACVGGAWQIVKEETLV